MYTTDNPSHSVEEEVKHFLNGSTYNKLSDVDRDVCDTPLNLAKLGAALKHIKNDSSPGSDGITAGFYKMFCQKLKLPLFKSLQNLIEIGELSTSQRRGIINLIHKGNNTNRYELKKPEAHYINKRGLQDIHEIDSCQASEDTKDYSA